MHLGYYKKIKFKYDMPFMSKIEIFFMVLWFLIYKICLILLHAYNNFYFAFLLHDNNIVLAQCLVGAVAFRMYVMYNDILHIAQYDTRLIETETEHYIINDTYTMFSCA